MVGLLLAEARFDPTCNLRFLRLASGKLAPPIKPLDGF